MTPVRLYTRLIGAALRAQLEYRTSYLLQAIGSAMICAVEFGAISALFRRFGHIAGWTLPEVALLYGITNIAWSVAESVGHGLDDFGGLVRRGEFDMVLTRPRSTLLQLFGRAFSLRRLGRLVQAVFFIGWAFTQLPANPDLGELLLLAYAVAGAIALFLGLLVIQAALVFWTTDSLELMNVLTYGGVQTAQYPVVIYPTWMRWLFLSVVPIGLVVYLPVKAVLHKTLLAPPLSALGPTAGILFGAGALWMWNMGVRRYTSAGG